MGGVSDMSKYQKRARERLRTDWLQQMPAAQRRTRTVRKPGGELISDVTIGDNYNSSHRQMGKPIGLEYVSDENHISDLKSYQEFHFSGDVGGEFFLERHGVGLLNPQSQHVQYVDNSSGQQKVTIDYNGPILATYPPNLSLPTVGSLRDLGPIGTKAIALVKPTNNVANLAVDLFEIKQEGLPKLFGAHLWKDKTLSAKAAGSEYLNEEFGWKPLVSDIRSGSYAAANAHKILESYERNSHKMVRRRYEFPVEMSENWSTVGTPVRAVGSPNAIESVLWDPLNTRGSVVKCTRFYRRTWFSGAFTYHLPVGFNSRHKLISAASQAGPLLGIELTPEVIWSATPWSWALDWVSNMGDIVSIYSDMQADGLVIKYGYVMEHTVTSDTYYFTGKAGYRPGTYTGWPTPIVSYVETKRRKKATPFGFEVTWNSFTPRQLAIAAALGITRVF